MLLSRGPGLRCGGLALILVLGSAWVLRAEEWNRFRGPDGQGVRSAGELPVHWKPGEARWSAELPDTGHSSPVVWGRRVFVTSTNAKTAVRHVVCLGLDDGRVLWSREYASMPYEHHRDNSFASATPAVDARGVYLTWTTPEEVTLRALSHTGDDRWTRRLGPFRSKFGSGASPIVHDGLVVLANDHLGDSFLLAVDGESGETRWRVPRKSGPTAFATPCRRPLADGSSELVFLSTAHGMTGVDPFTGTVRWEIDDLAENAERERPVASPVLAGSRVIGTFGMAGQGSQLFVVDPPEKGAETGPRLLRRLYRDVPYVPTPVVVGDLLFVLRDNGGALAYRLPDLEPVWRERLPGGFYASPVCLADRLYCVSKSGAVFVLAADETFRVLARNELGEATFATPAVEGGKLLFRTLTRVICLEAGD